jgi:hypothetical protein
MVKRHGKDTIWKVKISSGERMLLILSPRWRKVASHRTPLMKDIDAELSRYKQDATRLTQQTGASSVEEVGNLYLLNQLF